MIRRPPESTLAGPLLPVKRRIRALVLQRAASGKGPLQSAPAGVFQRRQAGRALVLVDCGRPPPPGYDRLAHVGTLSFEMSVGRERLIVNCGAQGGTQSGGWGPGAGEWRAAQRSTAAHSTATLGDRSEEHTSELQSLMRISYAVFCLKTKT